MTPYIEDLLAKARWRRVINKRGYEGRLPVASERLAETLRMELRAILDNDGKPFDLQVARHVYDFAIAAKDLLTVSVKNVEDAMRVVADNNGAMESLTGPNDPQRLWRFFILGVEFFFGGLSKISIGVLAEDLCPRAPWGTW